MVDETKSPQFDSPGRQKSQSSQQSFGVPNNFAQQPVLGRTQGSRSLDARAERSELPPISQQRRNLM